MNRPISILMLGAVGLVAGCLGTTPAPIPAGDFCVVQQPLPYASVPVADYVAEHDPRLADRIDATNTYGARHCPGWEF